MNGPGSETQQSCTLPAEEEAVNGPQGGAGQEASHRDALWRVELRRALRALGFLFIRWRVRVAHS